MIRILFYFFRRGPLKQKPELCKMLLFFVVLVWFASSGYLYFEMESKPDLKWGDTLWWAIVTMTTVGYGDYFPETAGGRYLVGFPTMIFGIGFFGYVLSEIASNLIESKSRRLRGMERINLSDHIIIVNFCNLEKILKLIQELKADLSTQGKDICLVDETLEELPGELHEMKVRYIKGNPTTELTLNNACIADASHVIVLAKDPGDLHSDDQNLATVLMIEHLQPSVITVAECLDPKKTRPLKAAGCDRIVNISDLTTNLLVQELQDPGSQEVITEITSNIYGHQLYIVQVGGMKDWKSKELIEWSVDNDFVLLGIKREDKIFLNCKKEFDIEKGDKAIILGLERPEKIVTA